MRPQHLILLLALLLSSCHYREEEATLYEVGDNFELCVDSLALQGSQPLHNLPVDTLCEQPVVSLGNPLVVAETIVIPEDSVDSIWVKRARDQYTMGWVHERDFLESVVPDDPISLFIHIFSKCHLWLFGVLFAISMAVLLWQTFGQKRRHAFFFRDILSPYPTFLLITLAASALLYAGIQHYVSETWQFYYYHPTLNPFGLPPVLSLFLCSVWVLLILALATLSEVFRLLPTAEAVLYLFSLLAPAVLCYLISTLVAVSPAVGYILFALFALTLFLRYYRHSRPRFLCGACGKRLRELGKCPYCGAENR